MGQTGWKLDQLQVQEDEYISIKWNHNGAQGAIVCTSIVLQDDDEDYGYIVCGRHDDDKNAASGSSGRMCDGTVGDEHRNFRSDRRKFVLQGK